MAFITIPNATHRQHGASPGCPPGSVSSHRNIFPSRSAQRAQTRESPAVRQIYFFMPRFFAFCLSGVALISRVYDHSLSMRSLYTSKCLLKQVRYSSGYRFFLVHRSGSELPLSVVTSFSPSLRHGNLRYWFTTTSKTFTERHHAKTCEGGQNYEKLFRNSFMFRFISTGRL